MLRLFDAFSGIGGFRLALENLGVQCVGSLEKDKDAFITYASNFHAKPHYWDMVNPELLPDFDILTAGFPCQPYSIEGKRKGTSEKENSDILHYLVNVLNKKKPRFFIFENVKGFLSIEKGGTHLQFAHELMDEGYWVSNFVYNTGKHTHIPQNRERLFIVGIKDQDLIFIPKLAKLNENDDLTPFEHFLEKSVHFCHYYENHFNVPNHKLNASFDLSEVKTGSVYQLRRGNKLRQNKSRLVPCLMASMGTGGNNVPIIRDDIGVRRLTPRECFRFQGFPDSFVFPDSVSMTALYKQIGNSVTVPLVRRVFMSLLDTVDFF